MKSGKGERILSGNLITMAGGMALQLKELTDFL